MPEPERPANIIDQPDSRLIPEKFAEKAPLGDGIHALEEWLGAHLPPEVRQNVTNTRDRQMPDPVPEDVGGFIEVLVDNEGDLIAETLEQYSFLLHRLYGSKADGKTDSAAMFEGWRTGMSHLFSSLGLSREKIVIDSLYERASAITVSRDANGA